MTINISLQGEQEKLIQAKLQSGKYENAYQVIVAALQLLEERDKQQEQWLEETRKKVAEGIEQVNPEQYSTPNNQPKSEPSPNVIEAPYIPSADPELTKIEEFIRKHKESMDNS